MRNEAKRIVTQFGYDATVDKGKRKAPRPTIRHEDDELTRANKTKLAATGLDQARNFALVGWMIRKHLDSVSRFTFQSMTNYDEIDKRLEFLWETWSKKRNCDMARRHSAKRMMRLFEASKAVDGQAGLLKIKGGKLQGIEGSRIAKPTTGTFPESIKKATDHGLIMDDYGAVDKFIICRRVNYALEFQSLVNWEDIAYDGYFFRFDQSVGITPFAAAMNTCQDLYEGFDYQLIKTKMHALLGVFITSAATQKASDGFGDVDANTGTAATPETTKYKYELRPGMKLEGKPGDDIKMIESHTPSAEFQQFSDMMIHISLLTFDIPISFFNSIKSNYSQSKFDLKTYEHSCRGKREDNQEILHEIAEWKLKQFHVQDSELAGMLAKRKLRLEDVSYEFVPEGIPWIDEVAEIQAATARIDAALSTRTHECKIHGGRFRDNLRVLKLEEQEIKEAGVTVVRGMPGQSTKPANDPQPVDQNPDNQPKTDPEGNQNAA